MMYEPLSETATVPAPTPAGAVAEKSFAPVCALSTVSSGADESPEPVKAEKAATEPSSEMSR